MTLDLTLRIALAAALFGAALGLRRTPFRRAWDWWLVLAAVGAFTAFTAWCAPGAAGATGLAAYAVLVALPWALVRSAWQRAARGDIPAAHTRVGWVRWLHPLGDARVLGPMVDLAARMESGEAVDLAAALSALGIPEGLERTLAGLVLVSWSGDFARVGTWLQDPLVRREAVRRGHAALVLAAAGETDGPEAVVRAWDQLVADDRAPAPSAHAAGVMLVAAAHLGAVEPCRALVRELSREVPPARAAYWLATAEQRAGDVVSAHATLAAAAGVPGLTHGALRRLEHRMMHPLEPVAVPTPPAVAALAMALRTRVEARGALAGLGLGSRRPSPVTWTLVAVLVAVFLGELVAGMGSTAGETLYRLGGLPVPLPSPWSFAALRVLTYGLVHASGWHLGVNVLTLVFFGRFIEQRLGGARMLAVYAVAGVLAGFAALLGSPDGTLVVGASGSIFGLVGASVGQILADRTLRTTPEGRSELALLAALLLVQAAGDLVTPHVSSAAHVGGMATGLLAGLVLQRKRERREGT